MKENPNLLVVFWSILMSKVLVQGGGWPGGGPGEILLISKVFLGGPQLPNQDEICLMKLSFEPQNMMMPLVLSEYCQNYNIFGKTFSLYILQLSFTKQYPFIVVAVFTDIQLLHQRIVHSFFFVKLYFGRDGGISTHQLNIINIDLN